MKEKALLDTSVLVAAFVKSHEAHEACLECYRGVLDDGCQGYVAAHTVAELYAVLTRMPARPRISPTIALKLVRDNIESNMNVVELSGSEYMSLIENAALLNLSGGVVYDSIIAMCAKKQDVDRLYTLNPSDFQRVWPEGKARICRP